MKRRRRNPFTESRPGDWSSMTKLQRAAWNRSHWSKGGGAAPLSFEKRAAARRYREATGRNPSKGIEHYRRLWQEDRIDMASIPGKYRNQIMRESWDAFSDRAARQNPRVKFRTCKGKRVSFQAKRRKKGKAPKHLKRYLFKKGHKPMNRCAKRSGRSRRKR